MRLALLLVLMLSGCISFRSKGDPEPMLDRGKRICESTNGEWVDYRCVYPAWPRDTTTVDTTTAVLGVQT